MIYLFAFLTVTFSLAAVMNKPRISMTDRLEQVMGQKQIDEPTLPLKERIGRPIVRKIAKIAPHGQKDKTASQLASAGINNRWPVDDWQGVKYGVALGGGAISLILAIFVPLMIIWRFEIVVVGFLLSYMAPNFWLKVKAKGRIAEIEESLPDVLDLLTISVEAGLGFDAALLKITEKGKGILATEFLRVLQEIRMGRPRRDALRGLAARNHVEDLSNWVAALVQADQLGISIGGVMRTQAKQIRTKRRQRIEEKAQKAPVKIMIPLVLFIFPCVFVVVLGPAVIQLISLFGGH